MTAVLYDADGFVIEPCCETCGGPFMGDDEIARRDRLIAIGAAVEACEKVQAPAWREVHTPDGTKCSTVWQLLNKLLAAGDEPTDVPADAIEVAAGQSPDHIDLEGNQ